jgi:endonuclease-3
MATRPSSSTASKPAARKPRPVASNEPARIRRVLDGLAELYPDATCELDWKTPWQLLVATILSAQCTDVRVNQVTPRLFARYPDPASLAAADAEELEGIIRPTGFFRSKARHLRGAAQRLVELHQSDLPRTVEGLTGLPGVARKTANVVLGTAFRIPSGIVVDTHVKRLGHRLGLTDHTDPVKIERDLMTKVPEAEWIDLSHRLILHGRRVCMARSPRCQACALLPSCPQRGVHKS